MASFSKLSLLTCPCLRRKRVERSQAILEHLMTFEAASRLVSLSNYCLWCVFFFSVSWSRAYGLCGLSLYTSNDLTYDSIRFKKAYRHFLTANSKKRFRRLFSYDFGCKQKALCDFLASSSFWKRANTGKPNLCLPDSWFSETLYSQYFSSWMKIIVSVHVSPNYIYFIDC